MSFKACPTLHATVKSKPSRSSRLRIIIFCASSSSTSRIRIGATQFPWKVGCSFLRQKERRLLKPYGCGTEKNLNTSRETPYRISFEDHLWVGKKSDPGVHAHQGAAGILYWKARPRFLCVCKARSQCNGRSILADKGFSSCTLCEVCKLMDNWPGLRFAPRPAGAAANVSGASRRVPGLLPPPWATF